MGGADGGLACSLAFSNAGRLGHNYKGACSEGMWADCG